MTPLIAVVTSPLRYHRHAIRHQEMPWGRTPTGRDNIQILLLTPPPSFLIQYFQPIPSSSPIVRRLFKSTTYVLPVRGRERHPSQQLCKNHRPILFTISRMTSWDDFNKAFCGTLVANAVKKPSTNAWAFSNSSITLFLLLQTCEVNPLRTIYFNPVKTYHSYQRLNRSKPRT